MVNSVDFYKRIFLHVIPAHILVSLEVSPPAVKRAWYKLYFILVIYQI